MHSQVIDRLAQLIQDNITYSFIILYALCMGSVFLIYHLAEQDGPEQTTEVLEQQTTEESSDMLVEIAGAVERPGVYELSRDSRLSDLVRSADGFTKDASEEWLSKFINLSTPLSDAQKVYIPYDWDDPVDEIEQVEEIAKLTNNYTLSSPLDIVNAPKTQTLAEKDQTDESNDQTGTASVNVNTASQEDIDALPGIGPVYAARIIENRPYDDLESLVERSDVPSSVLEKIKDRLVF